MAVYDPSLWITLNKSLGPIGFPLDGRNWYYDPESPPARYFTSSAEILAFFPTSISRKGAFSAIVKETNGNLTEYWWPNDDNVTDDDLAVKNDLTGINSQLAQAALDIINLQAQIDVLDSQLAGAMSGYRGKLAIADTPTLDGFYLASQSGTYTNAGGLVVNLSQGFTLISKTGSVYTAVLIPLDTSTFITTVNTTYIQYGIQDANGILVFGILNDGTYYQKKVTRDELSSTVTDFLPFLDGSNMISNVKDINNIMISGVLLDGTPYPLFSGSDEETAVVDTTEDAWVNLYWNMLRDFYPSFRRAYYGPNGATADDFVRFVMLGNSIFAYSTETSIGNVIPSEYPPSLVTANFGANLWASMASLERGLYRRFDYTSFFSETGTWESVSTNTVWDTNTRIDSITRCSTGAGATITFTIPIADNRFHFLDRPSTEATNSVTISVTGGAGKIEVYNGSAWVEANGYNFSQLYGATGGGSSNTQYGRPTIFRKVGASIDTAVTLTFTNNTTSPMLYWGVYMVGGKKPYLDFYNRSRGNQDLADLAKYVVTDVLLLKPDFVLFELPLNNQFGGTLHTLQYHINALQDFIWGDRTGFENANALRKNFKRDGVTAIDVLIVIPHMSINRFTDGKLEVTTTDGYTCAEVIGAMMAYIQDRLDCAVINMLDVYRFDADANFDGNYITLLGDYTDDGTHQNDNGTVPYNRTFNPIFKS